MIPVKKQPEWLILEIPTCLIKVGNNIPEPERTRIEHAINVLKLNDDDEYVISKEDIISQYINKTINFNDI
jgi:hypothetical protein